jgi:hypothetical protein
MATSDQKSHPWETDRSLRVLGTFICFLAMVGHKWSEMLFKMADSEFKDALGDRYLLMLPEITKFTLQAFHSPLWSLGHWIPGVIMIAIWFARPAWSVAIMNGLVLLWIVTFLCVSPLSFWFGDMMIVHAIKMNAEKAKLLPK